MLMSLLILPATDRTTMRERLFEIGLLSYQLPPNRSNRLQAYQLIDFQEERGNKRLCTPTIQTALYKEPKAVVYLCSNINSFVCISHRGFVVICIRKPSTCTRSTHIWDTASHNTHIAFATFRLVGQRRVRHGLHPSLADNQEHTDIYVYQSSRDWGDWIRLLCLIAWLAPTLC